MCDTIGGSGVSEDDQYECTACLWAGGWCGDMFVQSLFGELCDTIGGGGASEDDQYLCAADCEWAGGWCDDGIVNGSEECDAGEDNGIACEPPYGTGGGVCTYCGENCHNITLSGTYCGDSIINGPEECDEGENNGVVCEAGGYGETCVYCNAICETILVEGPHCGDSIVNGPPGEEQCDTIGGSGISSEDQYACDTDCKWAGGWCDDGSINGLEECDLAEDNGKVCDPVYDGECSYCNTNCETATIKGGYCDDSIINGPEECDWGPFSTVGEEPCSTGNGSYCIPPYGGSCQNCESGCNLGGILEAPVQIGSADYGIFRNFFIKDNLAYLASLWDGIFIVDISNPALSPLPLVGIIPGGANDVYVNGDLAYVLGTGLGNNFKIYNVSDPSNPSLVSTYTTTYTKFFLGIPSVVQTHAFALEMKNNRIYIADERGLITFGIGRETTTGWFFTGFDRAAIQIVNDRLYFVSDLGQNAYDVSDSSVVAEEIAWSGPSGFDVCDKLYTIGDSVNIEWLSIYPMSGSGIYAKDNFAYIAGASFRIIDVSNTSCPYQVVGDWDTATIKVYVDDNYIYTTNSDSPHFRISDRHSF